MNTRNLLDEILLMLHSLKDSQEQLEKLHLYMRNELHTEENTTDEAVIIPERYTSLVKEVADSLSAGMVCYINPATLEKTDIPQSVIDLFDEEDVEDDETDPFYADLKRINRDWEETITINPPDSTESFSYMEQFISILPESRISKRLSDALSGRKPFSRFNTIIHQSDEREAWFAFRQKCLENYVAEILAGRLWKNEFTN